MEAKHSGVEAKCNEIKLQYGTCQKELCQQLEVQFLIYRDLWICRKPLLIASLIFALSYPSLEPPTSTACNISISRDRAKDWETKPAQNRPSLHPELFYTAGYIVPPHSPSLEGRNDQHRSDATLPGLRAPKEWSKGALWNLFCQSGVSGSLVPLQPGGSHWNQQQGHLCPPSFHSPQPQGGSRGAGTSPQPQHPQVQIQPLG